MPREAAERQTYHLLDILPPCLPCVQIRVSKADAEEARRRTRLLLAAVQAQLLRTDRAESECESMGEG